MKKVTIVISFLTLLGIGCQQGQIAGENKTSLEVPDRLTIKNDLVFLSRKKRNAQNLRYECRRIAYHLQSWRTLKYAYGEVDSVAGSLVGNFDGARQYLKEKAGYSFDGNKIYSGAAGSCELELLDEGEVAVIHGRNELYENVVVVTVSGPLKTDIKYDFGNLYSSYHDSLLYPERLRIINLEKAREDSILATLFTSLVDHSDKETQYLTVNNLAGRISAAGSYNGHYYEYPNDIQKQLFVQRYTDINNRIAALLAESDSLFYQLTKEPGRLRNRTIDLLAYLHPMTRPLRGQWKKPDVPIQTKLDITEIRKTVYQDVFKSGDYSGAAVALKDPGFKMTGLEPFLFQYLYEKGSVSIGLVALDRIERPSDAILDSLERFVNSRFATPRVYNAIARHRSERAGLILLKDIFTGSSDMPEMRDVLLETLAYSDSAKIAQTVANYYQTYCEVDRRNSSWRPVGGELIETTGNRYLLVQDLRSENKCYQDLALTYLNQIDTTYTAPIILRMINDDSISIAVRRNLLVETTRKDHAWKLSNYQYKYLEENLPLPSFWVKQLEENGPFSDLAISRIGYTKDKAFIPVVLNYIERGYAKKFQDKRMAAYSLIQLGAEEAGRYTIQLLQEADNNLAKKRLLGALERFKVSDSTIAPDIWPYLNQNSFSASSLSILGYSKHQGSINQIAPYLEAEQDYIRGQAAFAICMIGTREAKTIFDDTLARIGANRKEALMKGFKKCTEEVYN